MKKKECPFPETNIEDVSQQKAPNGLYQTMQVINDFIAQTVDEGQPRMMQLAKIDVETPTNHDIISLWAASGDGNPLERLREIRIRYDELMRLLTIVKDKALAGEQLTPKSVDEIEIVLRLFNLK